MRPIINKRALRFVDMWPKFDNVPPETPGSDMSEEEWIRSQREGFLQAWNSEDNLFSSGPITPPDPETGEGGGGDFTLLELKSIYARLSERYYSHVFNRLDEPHIRMGVFRIISDYFPNLVRRLTVYDEMFEVNLTDYQTTMVRSATNQSAGTVDSDAAVLENAINAPNTMGSQIEPIVDAISAQRNTKDTGKVADARQGSNLETVNSGISDAYQKKLSAIVDDLWAQFIERFKGLFTQLYVGTFDYLYYNKEEEEN